MIYRKSTLSYFTNLLATDYAEKTAIIWRTRYRRENIKYKTLLKMSQQLATYLLEQGFKKGDKIFVIGPNSPHWAVTLLGTLLAGLVLVPVDINSSQEFISKVINTVSPKLLILHRAVDKKVVGKNKFYFDQIFSTIQNYDENLLNKKYDYYISGNDIAEIIFTSGTTTEPKGVVLSHRNIGANINSASLRIMLTSHTKALSILPLSHMFEQTAGFFVLLRQGGSVVYLESLKPSNIKKALFEERVNGIVAVPAFLDVFKNLVYLNVEKLNKTNSFKKILTKMKIFPYFVRRMVFSQILKKLGGKLKHIIVGGAAISKDTEIFWNSIGVPVTQGYGLTETGPVISCSDFNKPVFGSVGTSLDFQRVKLASDSEILTCGENVFSGYFNQPELNKKIFENGWFKTGDIGEIDENGNIYIKGRKKNIIVAPSGLNIYPEDIELKLQNFDKIIDAIVIKGVGDTFYLEGYFTSENNVERDEINKMLITLNNQLLPQQRIKNLSKWPQKDFPRTPTKKIIRREIYNYLNNKEKITNSQKKENFGQNDSILQKVIEIFQRTSDCKDIVLTKNTRIIEDIGLDSIDLLETLTHLEAEFQIDIPEQEFYQIKTINDIITLIMSQQQNTDNKEDTPTIKKKRFNLIKIIFKSIFFTVFRILSFIFFRVRVRGKENIKNIIRPHLFIANHASHLDTISLLRSLPPFIRRKTIVAAAEDYFFKKKRFITKILSFFINLFAFYRKEMMRTNLLNMGRILDNGWNILIFPEGTRSRNGNLQPFKDGIGMLVKELDVPCIPIRIDNGFNILPPGKSLPKQGTITIKYGKPIRFPATSKYTDISNTLHDTIEELENE